MRTQYMYVLKEISKMAEKNVRQAEISRKTNETDIKMKLVIDGTG